MATNDSLADVMERLRLGTIAATDRLDAMIADYKASGDGTEEPER